MTRLVWLLGVIAGIALLAVVSAFLIVAIDGASHGEASLRHAAPIPVAAIVLVLAVVSLLRFGPSAPRRDAYAARWYARNARVASHPATAANATR